MEMDKKNITNTVRKDKKKKKKKKTTTSQLEYFLFFKSRIGLFDLLHIWPRGIGKSAQCTDCIFSSQLNKLESIFKVLKCDII